jgi:hypothetical protein
MVQRTPVPPFEVAKKQLQEAEEAVLEARRVAMLAALKERKGNQRESAELLEMTLRTFTRRLAEMFTPEEREQYAAVQGWEGQTDRAHAARSANAAARRKATEEAE